MYTSHDKLKRQVPLTYAREIEGKLTEDGWITGDTLENGGEFNEEGFLSQFISDATLEIDAYCHGPFELNGILDRIAVVLALFYFEQYYKAAQGDRNVGVTIYADKKMAYSLMDKINAGEILVSPLGGSGGKFLVKSDSLNKLDSLFKRSHKPPYEE